MLCEAFKKWREGLVKPKPAKDLQNDGIMPVNKPPPMRTTEEEKPELTDGLDEEEVRRDPAQEVQAVRKKEITKGVVFSVTHGFRNSPLIS